MSVVGPIGPTQASSLAGSFDSDSGARLAPDLILFDAFAVVSLFGVIGKLAEQFTGDTEETVIRSTVRLALALAAGFHRAAVTPKRLTHVYAVRTVHLLTVGTLSA